MYSADASKARLLALTCVSHSPNLHAVRRTYVRYLLKLPLCDVNKLEEAVGYLVKAMPLTRDKFDIVYILAMLYTNSNVEKSIQYMDQCIGLRPTNGLLHYNKSLLRFMQMSKSMPHELEHFRDCALAALEQGNQSPELLPLSIAIPAPSMLRKAWESAGVRGIPEESGIFFNGSFLLELKSQLSKTLESPLLLRISQAQFSLGRNFMKRATGEGLGLRHFRSYQTLQLINSFSGMHCKAGYETIEASYRNFPDKLKREFLERYKNDARIASVFDELNKYYYPHE